MKKLLRTFILSILTLSLTLTAFACGDPQDEEKTVEPIKKVDYEGTHIYNQTETGKYLVKDGQTDYVLVVTDSVYSLYSEAKSDFVILFEKATGIVINVVTDDKVTYSENAKYISLGETALVEQAGISKDEYSKEKLKDCGVRIITKGDSIFLLGSTYYGINYSIYVLFELMFNFEMYYRNCMYIDTGVFNVPLMNYDVTDVPDIDYRGISDRVDWKSSDMNAVTEIDTAAFGSSAVTEIALRGNRFKTVEYGWYDLMMPAHPYLDNPTVTASSTVHNILTGYLIRELSEQKWYSDSGKQCCFTAHGDLESRERFIKRVADVVMNSIQQYPTELYPQYKAISFSCTDGSTASCMCEACSKIAEDNNGAYLAAAIMFVNEVNAIVQPWLEENKDKPWYRDDFEIQLLSYSNLSQAPVYFDDNGNPTPCSEEVICQKGTAIYFAGGGPSIEDMQPMYDEANDEVRKNIAGLSMLTENSSLWIWHNAGMRQQNMFYDALGIFNADYYEFLAYYGIEELYQFNIWGYQEHTSFMNLSFYISKKLSWDCSLDVNELIDNFMTNMYGREAGEILWKLYEKLSTHYYTVHDAMFEQYGSVYSGWCYKPEYWPYQLNLMWYNEVKKAVKTNDYLKEEDPALYTVLTHRIELEAVAPLYTMIDLYSASSPREYNDEQLAIYKAELAEITRHHKLMSCGGGANCYDFAMQ